MPNTNQARSEARPIMSETPELQPCPFCKVAARWDIHDNDEITVAQIEAEHTMECLLYDVIADNDGVFSVSVERDYYYDDDDCVVEWEDDGGIPPHLLPEMKALAVKWNARPVANEAFDSGTVYPRPDSMDELQKEIGEWQRATFPDSTLMSKWRHLNREMTELWKAVQRADVESNEHGILDTDTFHGLGDELADCQHLLFGISDAAGLSLSACTRQKFAVNQQRKWGEPDEHGVVEHVREESQ